MGTRRRPEPEGAVTGMGRGPGRRPGPVAKGDGPAGGSRAGEEPGGAGGGKGHGCGRRTRARRRLTVLLPRGRALALSAPGGRGRVRRAGPPGLSPRRLRCGAAVTSEGRRRGRPAASSAAHARCVPRLLLAAAAQPAPAPLLPLRCSRRRKWRLRVPPPARRSRPTMPRATVTSPCPAAYGRGSSGTWGQAERASWSQTRSQAGCRGPHWGRGGGTTPLRGRPRAGRARRWPEEGAGPALPVSTASWPFPPGRGRLLLSCIRNNIYSHNIYVLV